jgi:DNA-binding CsgD family transcriptional regulator
LRVLARILRADVLASLVGPAAARQLAESALTEGALRRGDWCGDVSGRVVARLRYACDDRTDTMNALLRCCGGAGLSWVAAANRPYWAAQLADMSRAFGDQALAARWVDRAERYAQPLGLRGQAAHVAMARARLALDADSPTALALAGAAVEAFGDLGWLVNEANARLLRASVFGATEQWRAAEAELAEVRRIADLTGARVLHQLVVGEQRRIGGRAGRLAATEDATSDRLALTRREWDIVQLVAAGTSNAEVADRLYVSVKTVEAHLTRIFRKLGVSSRVGLVALVAMQSGSDSPSPGSTAP